MQRFLVVAILAISSVCYGWSVKYKVNSWGADTWCSGAFGNGSTAAVYDAGDLLLLESGDYLLLEAGDKIVLE